MLCFKCPLIDLPQGILGQRPDRNSLGEVSHDQKEKAMSDTSLRQDIIDELDFERNVNSAHIGVAVGDGVVTLSGHD